MAGMEGANISPSSIPVKASLLNYEAQRGTNYLADRNTKKFLPKVKG